MMDKLKWIHVQQMFAMNSSPLIQVNSIKNSQGKTGLICLAFLNGILMIGLIQSGA